MPQNDIQRLEKKLTALRSKLDKGISGKKKVDTLTELAHATYRSNPEKTERYARRALTLAKKSNYAKGIARSNQILGISYWTRNIYGKATYYYRRALRTYKKICDDDGIATSYHGIGIVYAMQSDFDQALRYFLKSLRIREDIGDKKSIIQSYNAIGSVYSNKSDHAQALKYCRDALRIAEKIGAKREVANLYLTISRIYFQQGDYVQVMKYAYRSLSIYDALGDKKHIAGSQTFLGITHDMQGEYKGALGYYNKALKIQQAINDEAGQANSYTNIGITHQKQGLYTKALKNHLRALYIRQKINDRVGTEASYNHIGLIYEKKGSPDRALQYHRKALKIQKAIGDKPGTARSHNNIGHIYTKLGRYSSALRHLNKGLKICQQIGAKEGVLDSYRKLSELHEARSTFAQALDYYKKFTDLEKQVYNAEKSKQITEMKTKYETEKKEKEAEIYQLKNVALRKEIRQRKKAEKELKKHRDTLEQVVAERTAQLRSLAHELSLVEEKQRRQIATYLHDEINQALALASFKIESLQDISSTKTVDEELNNIKEILDQTAQRIRSLTFEISPPILYELGLEPAVEWLLEQFGKQYNITCKFKDDGLPKPMTDDARILLFQSVRELLTNVSKHANAQSVTVSALRDGRVVRIAVEDDGIGFDPEVLAQKISKNQGFGLFNVKERLRHLRGQLDVESTLGEGTTVVLVAPLGSKRTQK